MTHEEMETAIARLFEGQDLLTGKVVELAEEVGELSNALKITREEAEAGRKLQREAIEQIREQAEADGVVQREAIAEMREAVSRMIDIAESMESNVVLLTRMQKGTQGSTLKNLRSGLIRSRRDQGGERTRGIDKTHIT